MRCVLAPRLDRGMHLWGPLFSLMLSFLLGIKCKRFPDLEGQQDLSLARHTAIIHPRSPLCSALGFSDTPNSFLWLTFAFVSHPGHFSFRSSQTKLILIITSQRTCHLLKGGHPCPSQIKVWPSVAA